MKLISVETKNKKIIITVETGFLFFKKTKVFEGTELILTYNWFELPNYNPVPMYVEVELSAWADRFKEEGFNRQGR